MTVEHSDREAGELTLGDIVIDNAVRHPDVVAYRHGERVLTHGELRERAERLVSALMAAGVDRQDRIAVYSRNAIEFGEIIAATQLSGIILATVNFRSSPVEVRDALERVRPAVVFVAAEFAGVLDELSSRLTWSPLIVCIGGRRRGLVDYDEFIGSGSTRQPLRRACADDIACLLFTSGTTGPSKCCVLGQRELRRVFYAMNAEMATGSHDRGLINMPMCHVGAIGIIGGLHARGGTVVLQEQFDVADALRLVAAERISVLHLAPVMLRALLEAVGDGGRALETVRTVVYSAAPMNRATLARAIAVMPQAGFLNLYGQTEAIVSGLPRELHDPAAADNRLRSVGYPFPGVRVRIVGDDGRDVIPGSPGEIVVRSDALFRGYWNDAAATLVTLRDGWCHTGDVGRFDEAGLLYLVDRKKDVIITGGENVYSPEVENVLGELPEVAGCAVLGIPDPRWGEAVCAVVVPRAGAAVTLERLQEAVRLSLAGYKVPRRLVIAAELPVLASGKVDKKRLRAEFAADVGEAG
jgi:acyl-CoA synthetase (AMP-forming)/AMP-acid ligase II